MNKKRNIDKIKNLEGSPKVIKNLFSKNEIEKGHVCSSILLYDFIKNYNLIKFK